MKAVVVKSNSRYFKAGETFEISHVDHWIDGLPYYFDIVIPDQRYGGRIWALCKQDGCYHLNGGKWGFMPDD